MKVILAFLGAIFFVITLSIPTHSQAYLREVLQNPLSFGVADSVYCWQEPRESGGFGTDLQDRKSSRCHIDLNEDQMGIADKGTQNKTAERVNCIHMLVW